VTARAACRAPDFNHGASLRESKGKQMKAKRLSFAFFCFLLFFGIGAFQRVTGEKNEKISLSPTRLPGCAHSALALLSPGRTARVRRSAGSRVFHHWTS
jgi:hypothetical protein